MIVRRARRANRSAPRVHRTTRRLQRCRDSSQGCRAPAWFGRTRPLPKRIVMIPRAVALGGLVDMVIRQRPSGRRPTCCHDQGLGERGSPLQVQVAQKRSKLLNFGRTRGSSDAGSRAAETVTRPTCSSGRGGHGELLCGSCVGSVCVWDGPALIGCRCGGDVDRCCMLVRGCALTRRSDRGSCSKRVKSGLSVVQGCGV